MAVRQKEAFEKPYVVGSKSKKDNKKFDDPTLHRTEDKENPGVIHMNAQRKRDLQSVANQLADDFIYYRNERIDCLLEAFPYDGDMTYVDRFYPHAPKGAIYIDSPQTRQEQTKCEKKAHVMLKAGLKYCFIIPGEFLEDVLKRVQNVVDDGKH